MAACTAASSVVNKLDVDGLAGVLRGLLGLLREGRLGGLGGEGDGDGAGAGAICAGACLSVTFGLSLDFVVEVFVG